MNFLVKILITFAVVGLILLFFAAGVQDVNRPLADIFGYTGLGLWGVDVSVVGIVFLYKVWWDEL